ncbi:MAG: hypothetical protein FWG70_00350 [Oscillospiraceae bacterium]|nr:hypothetical protein [Oscillospiraceae bacterium]
MKESKKLLASVLAITMLFSVGAVQAFAFELEGDGDVVGADLKKVLVELPTSANMNFMLDPQGLASQDYDSEVILTNLNPDGKIVMQSKAGALFVNKSSFPVVVEVDAKLTGHATSVIESAVDSNTLNNVSFNIVASAAKTTDAAADFAAADTAVNAITVLDEAGKKANFALQSAVYVVEQEGTAPDYTYDISLKSGEAGDGTKIQLAGKINTKADWSDFTGKEATKKVGVAIKFTVFEIPTGDVGTDGATKNDTIPALNALMRVSPNEVENAYALLPASGSTIMSLLGSTPPALELAPPEGFAKSSMSYSEAGTVANQWFAVDFGYGGKTVKSVTMNGTATTTAFRTEKMSEHKIEFNFGNNTAQRVMIVTMSDDTKHTITFTVS